MIIFDRFNDSLFTANHLPNLASSLFNVHSSSNWLSPAQNTFVSSCENYKFDQVGYVADIIDIENKKYWA